MKSQKNKKIIFDDNGETTTVSADLDLAKENKSTKKSYQNRAKENIESDINRWYEEYAEYNVSENSTDLIELKDAEIRELSNICRLCFQAEESSFSKKNPSDAKWLETALHKGTSKDRANAGSLLVQSNPVGNIKALETLISLTKISNKSSTDAVDIITQLFISGLLPPNRKLLSIKLRGADWKHLRKQIDLNKNIKDKIYAYWHYESLLKDQYFEFLRNIQTAIQGTQDSKKNQAIVCTSQLLIYGPEMEQMLLSMLVNKLGDPSNKVASKALHHLSEIAYRHPAMCDVIIKETEKLLFRNNITEHAQHFALCFLSQIASRANSDVSARLVNICFSFFKIVVQKGAVNSKTMQAILRCLKRAIADANPTNKDGFLTKDMEDTMYRLLHLADIHITLQTFALLLQIMSASISNGLENTSTTFNRYYNALYKKMFDLNLTNVGPKSAAQFLHIIHRSIYMDANVSRAQAFVKRLLQAALYFPVQVACGCLIVINKLIKMRPEIAVKHTKDNLIIEEPSDDENIDTDDKATDNKPIIKYDGFHRVPAYAGAETVLNTELLRLNQHYHPTVQIFAQNIIDRKNIHFYGDPLLDFSLTQFLERFSFRNPRKIDDDAKKLPESMVKAVHHRPYTAFGGRGLPVKHLTNQNCTEDERFIFQYLEHKRAKQAALNEAKKNANVEDNDDDDVESVNDDEFDAYLDGLGGKGKDDDELDFMNDLGEDLKETDGGKKKRKKKKVESDDDEDGAGVWDDDDEEVQDDDDKVHSKVKKTTKNTSDEDEEFDSDDDEGSISLDDEDDAGDSDDSNIFEDDSDADNNDAENSEDKSPPAKKLKPISGKEFRRSLKNTDDMSSLFAAVDDFSEMLNDSGNASKTHGTLSELCNKDRSSEKQLYWETNRSKSNGGFGQKRGFKKNFQKKFQQSRSKVNGKKRGKF